MYVCLSVCRNDCMSECFFVIVFVYIPYTDFFSELLQLICLKFNCMISLNTQDSEDVNVNSTYFVMDFFYGIYHTILIKCTQ